MNMNFGVVRNKNQVLELVERIKQMRLPFKYAFQDIYPTRSLESNKYYWGVVLKFISEATGHSPMEIHEAYKQKFLIQYDFIYHLLHCQYMFWIEPTASTAKLDEKQIWDYIFQVRADAELELHITIPLPNEAFVPELDFDHDKVEHKRL